MSPSEIRRDPTEEELHETNLRLQSYERQAYQSRKKEQLYAQLTIKHHFDPEKISSLLKLRPDDVVRDNEAVIDTERYRISADCTIWKLSTRGKIRDQQPEDHIEWIFEQISGKLPTLRFLERTGGDIAIHVFSRNSFLCFAVELSVEMLSKLAQYRLRIDFAVLTHEDE